MCTNYYCLSHFILCTTTFWPFRFFFPIVVLCKMVFSDCYTIQNAYLSRFLRPNFQRLMCIQSPFSLPHSTFPNVHSPFFFFFSSNFSYFVWSYSLWVQKCIRGTFFLPLSVTASWRISISHKIRKTFPTFLCM